MGFDSALLDIVCCPVTQMPLELLPQSKLARLNALIEQHKIKNRDGVVIEVTLEQALMTRDGRLAYPIRDGIPVLLEEQGVLLVQIDDAEVEN